MASISKAKGGAVLEQGKDGMDIWNLHALDYWTICTTVRHLYFIYSYCLKINDANLQQFEMGQNTELNPLVSLLSLLIPKSFAT